MRQKRVHPLEPIPETNAKGNLRLNCGAPVLPLTNYSTLHLRTIKWKPIRSGLHSFDQIFRSTTRRPLDSRPSTSPRDRARRRRIRPLFRLNSPTPFPAPHENSRVGFVPPLKNASRSTTESLPDTGRKRTTRLASVASSTSGGGAAGARIRHHASSQGRRQLESCERKPASNTGSVGVCHKDPIPSSPCRDRHGTVIMAGNQGFGIRSAKVRQVLSSLTLRAADLMG
jgi:hypothetical protein